MDTLDNMQLQADEPGAIAPEQAQPSSAPAAPEQVESPSLLQRARHLYWSVFRWFEANSFSPNGVGSPWSHPASGYLVALVGQALALTALLAIIHAFPSSRFLEVLPLLVIVLVALGWGAGPSVVATLLGAALLTYFILPPFFSLGLASSTDTVAIIFFLIAGFTLSVLASQTQRARYHAETISQRLETIIESIPDSLIIYDQQGESIQFNRVARETVSLEQQSLSLAEMPERLQLRTLNGKIVPPEDLPLSRALHGETVIDEELTYLVAQNHKQRVVSISAAPLRSVRDGTIEGGVTISRDQTALRQAERIAAERASQLEAIFESITDAVFILDTQGAPLQLNTAARNLMGLAEGEQLDSARALPFDLLDSQAHPLPREQWPAARLRRGEKLSGEATADVLIRTRDGSRRYLSVSGAPMYDLDGSLYGTVLVLHDVTERRQAEDQAQFLAEISKVLVSTLDYSMTLDNIARLVTPRLADWFTVDLLNEEGRFDLLVVKHIDPDKVRWARELRQKFPLDPLATTGVPSVVRTGQAELAAEITDEQLVASARNEEELAMTRQLGLSSVMTVPLVARSNILGAVTFVAAESGRKYNLADLSLAEEVGRRAGVALDNAQLYRVARQARDQLDIILQGVGDGIIVYNSQSQIIYANDAAASMMGFASAQAMLALPNMSITARYDMIDEQGQPFPLEKLAHRKVFAGEKEAQAIIGYRLKNNASSELWSIVKSRPVYDQHGDILYAITIVHDITERTLAERRKDEFISMASHELKTPVTSIKGFTQVLQSRFKKRGDEETLRMLNIMDAQLVRLTKLIGDLLDISKMQAGQLTYREEQIDLDELARETVENLQAATPSHQLRLEGHTGASIFGDRDRLAQVFINLLTNAVKYSPQADAVIIRLSTDITHACISVQDFGIGIDESHHQKIFQRFYQVTGPTERTYPGLGIGLYLAKQIVQRHHGHMWVESKKGQGSTFNVTLPLLSPKTGGEDNREKKTDPPALHPV